MDSKDVSKDVSKNVTKGVVVAEKIENEIELREQYRRLTPAIQKSVAPTEDDYVTEMLARFARADAIATSALIAQAAPHQVVLPFSPMPTDLCRCSPFFPLNQKQLSQRDYVNDLIITKSAWGEITYTGQRLSVYDEDVLLAILAVLNNKRLRQDAEIEGAPTYKYNGSILPILKVMGYDKPNSSHYNRVRQSLKRMTATGIEIKINGKRRGKSYVRITDNVNMISRYKWDEDKKDLLVIINPFFYENYLAGTCTYLDMSKRSKLRSPIAKSLMRFVESHREDEWAGHVLTLAATLNMDISHQELIETRRRLRSAIQDLVKEGILVPGSNVKGDIVTLLRKPRPQAALPLKRKKKSKA